VDKTKFEVKFERVEVDLIVLFRDETFNLEDKIEDVVELNRVIKLVDFFIKLCEEDCALFAILKDFPNLAIDAILKTKLFYKI